MPHWLIDGAELGVGTVVTAIILGYIHRRGVTRRKSALREGRPTSFEAFLRGSVAPYPRKWRYGWIDVNLGAASWKPRFSFRRKRIPLPASATVASIRRVAGLVEAIRTNPDCVVIVVRAGDVSLDLAVRNFDLPTALESLSSQSGVAWRVPMLDVESGGRYEAKR